MDKCKTCEYATEDNRRVNSCMFPRCVKEYGFIADKTRLPDNQVSKVSKMNEEAVTLLRRIRV